ncbi:MAG: hypothetical protein WDZ37_03010 [Solirubrobacterales bacterium]
MKAAVQRPALRLQSDERLAALGRTGSPSAFEAIVHRYRRPLVRHCTGLVGAQRAGSIVDQTFAQARALLRDDARASEPGPWLFWMAHNMAIAELRRDAPAASNGHANGSADGSANGSAQATAGNANGATEVVKSNGAADTTPNGAHDGADGNGAALSTLTFSESTHFFGQDTGTKRLAGGARVRMRNSVGHLVPTTLLEYKAPQAARRAGGARGGDGSTAAGATAGKQSHNLRAAIVIFGLCAIVGAGAFIYDRSDNVDGDKLTGFGSVAPGSIPGGDAPTIPGQSGGPGDFLGGGAGTPGAIPTTPPSTTTPPSATTIPPAGTSATPPADGSSDGSSTTSSSTDTTQPGIAGLLSLFGVDTSTPEANPLSFLLGLIGAPVESGSGAAPSSPGSRAPKTAPSSGSGAAPTPGTSAPSTPSPTPAAPVEPTLPPLGKAGPTISYEAAKGQKNDISVSRATSKKFKITDRGVSSITVNSGCRLNKISGPSKTEICAVKGVDRFDFKLGNKDDVLDLRVVTPATIAGEAGDDTLTGGRGDDSISGGRGADRLDGSSGGDTLVGDAGGDSLTGGRGDDVLTGGDGADTLDGGKGTDSFEAGADDDSIDAVDGKADKVSCGSGTDSVRADVSDSVDSDCERVTRS